MNAADRDLERVLMLAEAFLAGAPRIVSSDDFEAFERVRDAHLTDTLSR